MPFRSQSAYLLFSQPSFTASGRSSFDISLVVLFQSPFSSNRASYFSLSMSKLATKTEILSFHDTLVASGYFDFNASVTSAGTFLNCAKAGTAAAQINVSNETNNNFFMVMLLGVKFCFFCINVLTLEGTSPRLPAHMVLAESFPPRAGLTLIFLSMLFFTKMIPWPQIISL